MNEQMLCGQVALVTGASRGIGRACLHELATNGATVIGTATSEIGAQDITSYLKLKNFLGVGKILNVTSPADVEKTLNEVETEFGGVSILVNNAGITRDNLLLRMKQEEWDEIINVNLTSVFRLCKSALRPMMKARYGRIINITSVAGEIGNAGQTNYSASKTGIVGFSKSLAREIASRNITVNCVAPGFIETDMTRALNESQRATLLQHIPLGRFGDISEVAAAVVFLSSPKAAFITGATLDVNGGMYMG